MEKPSCTYLPRDSLQPQGGRPWCADCDTDSYLAVDSVAGARGFRFGEHTGGDADGDGPRMGDEAPSEGQVLVARTPRAGDLRIVRGGAEVARADGHEVEHRSTLPGVYRAEARIGGRPWILSNPIYLR